jgi:hypothetical protein
MSSPLPFPPPGFDQVSRREQLDYIEKLLDYIKPDEKCVEIPDWHREILEELMAHYRKVGFEGTTWEEFEQELEKEFFQPNNLR